MSEYDDVVEQQRLLLEAEEWSKGVKSLHSHSLTSMWYETEATKADIEENGPVTDVEYNSGIIERSRNGKLVRVIGEKLTGRDLVDAYCKAGK